MFDDTVLMGAYDFDDEGVVPSRVELVAKGKLLNLVASRAPTKKIKKTTGHGRASGFSDARATLGCLYISDDNAVSDEELRSELVEAHEQLRGCIFALERVSQFVVLFERRRPCVALIVDVVCRYEPNPFMVDHERIKTAQEPIDTAAIFVRLR